MPPIAPSRRNKLKPTKQKTHNKFTRQKKPNNNPFYSKINKSTKNTKPSQKKTTTNSKSNDKCFKCGKYGHHAKDCKVKSQIKSLDLASEITENIYRILELRNTDSEFAQSDNEHSSSPYDSGNEQSDSPDIVIGCQDECCKSVNVLSKTDEQ